MQMSANYFEKPITSTTKYCAVLGHPIRHSASPIMHNAALGAMGLNWRYLAFDVLPHFIPEVLKVGGIMGFVGFNLTVPHKIIAFDSVDIVDEEASKYEAVNTVRFDVEVEPGVWIPVGQVEDIGERPIRSYGFNTDAEAVARALKEDLDFEPAGKIIFIVGTGGAGKTAALRLAQMSVKRLYLYNRTLSKVIDIVKKIQEINPLVEVIVGYPEEEIDLLINGTSLGLKPDDPLPVDISRFPLEKAKAVYDMIYNPPLTPLLQQAKKAGCKVANGISMLLYQGAAAFEIWTGLKPPLHIMRTALEEFVYK